MSEIVCLKVKTWKTKEPYEELARFFLKETSPKVKKVHSLLPPKRVEWKLDFLSKFLKDEGYDTDKIDFKKIVVFVYYLSKSELRKTFRRTGKALEQFKKEHSS